MPRKLLILLLCAALLLTGCTGSATNALGFHGIVRYEDMEYTRPDMDEIADILSESCTLALESEDLEAVVDGVWAFYEVYDAFTDNYNLSYIRYNADMTDYYWQQEYEFCAENSYVLESGLEELYMALAQSPIRDQLESDEYFGEGFFDYYEGESMYDDVLLDLLDQETALVNEYYELYTQSMEQELYTDQWYDDWAEALCQNFVELIALRQQIAEYCGYDSYPEFAYDFYYYRDYTCQEAESYLADIQTELTPLYRQAAELDIWDLDYGYCSEEDSYDFLRQCAEGMGGTIAEAFALLDQAELYDITYSENKNSISFELYFSTYYEPFLFMSPSLTEYDKLTLVHEFGHFCNDYASAGSYAGIDVAEVFSQGMEYLSLCCGPDTETLTKLKMTDCLCVYVEQAAYAAFEHQVYGLTGDDLTTEKVFELYRQIGTAYGFDSWDWDARDFVAITHFYTNPMYIISYVVSNDVALQLYQLEQDDPGAGLALYQENLTTEEAWFLAFVESAGLESPFAPGRLTAVRETLEAALGN